MEERKVPPAKRGNIDGISQRRPPAQNQAGDNSQSPDKQKNDQQTSNQKPSKDQKARQDTDKKQPKKSKNLLVIIPAVIVFIGLSALAVYTGLQQNSNGQQAGETGGQTSTQSETGDLIDQTINEIDQLSDQPDSSGEGLSDDRLEL